MGKKKEYNFEQPIRILSVKANSLDIIFYTLVLSLLCAAVLLILCMKDGKFGLYFDFWRVAVSIPLIILASFVATPLRELRTYVPKLAKKATWTLPELQKLTGKDEAQTIRTMTRVLESAYIVDPACEKQV